MGVRWKCQFLIGRLGKLEKQFLHPREKQPPLVSPLFKLPLRYENDWQLRGGFVSKRFDMRTLGCAIFSTSSYSPNILLYKRKNS